MDKLQNPIIIFSFITHSLQVQCANNYCLFYNPCIHTFTLNGPRREKTCLWGFANNKSADQPAHLRSLISDFVICLLESIISRLVLSKFSIF